MRPLLAPSLMCADWLHLQDEIERLERAGADLFHFDVMDTTFTGSTMMPPLLLPLIRGVSAVPFDVHIMSQPPGALLRQVLPHCAGGYVTVHAEATKELQAVMKEIRDAGGKAGVALNPGTPLCFLEEVADVADLVLLMTCNAGLGPRQELTGQLLRTISRARALLDAAGRGDVRIEVDGNITPENARRTRQAGADIFVLGTRGVFRPGMTIEESCADIRRALAAAGSP